MKSTKKNTESKKQGNNTNNQKHVKTEYVKKLIPHKSFISRNHIVKF